MKKYYLILLAFITLLLFVSCDITITHTPDEKEEPEITDPIEGNSGSSEEDIPTDAPVTYYHPELGVLPTMEELGLYIGMTYEEIVEQMAGEPGERSPNCGTRVYEWKLDDEKILFVWLNRRSATDETYYASKFAIGTNWHEKKVYIDEHLKDK